MSVSIVYRGNRFLKKQIPSFEHSSYLLWFEPSLVVGDNHINIVAMKKDRHNKLQKVMQVTEKEENFDGLLNFFLDIGDIKDKYQKTLKNLKGQKVFGGFKTWDIQ